MFMLVLVILTLVCKTVWKNSDIDSWPSICASLWNWLLTKCLLFFLLVAAISLSSLVTKAQNKGTVMCRMSLPGCMSGLGRSTVLVTVWGKSSPKPKCHKLMQKYLVFVTYTLKCHNQIKAKWHGIPFQIYFIVCGLCVVTELNGQMGNTLT